MSENCLYPNQSVNNGLADTTDANAGTGRITNVAADGRTSLAEENAPSAENTDARIAVAGKSGLLSAASRETPLYKVLYEQLRLLIEQGSYASGSLLPSENELAATYGLARPTVRNALDLLVAEGYIVKQQGKGSIVTGKPKEAGILSLRGTTSAVGRDKLSTQIIVKPEIRSWKEAFSYEISEREKNADCIYFERLRLVNGKPVFYDITMFANLGFPRFTVRNLENTSLFELLRNEYQVEVKGGVQQLFAIKADKALQNYFRVKPGHPVLQLNRKIETNRPGLYIYSKVFCNTQEYGLSGTF